MIHSPPSTLLHPVCDLTTAEAEDRKVVSVPCIQRLLGNLMNGMGKVAHIARGDPSHRDAAVLCHVD